MDFVFDRYLENSIKTLTREGRGKGMRISVRRDSKTGLFFMIPNFISLQRAH